jgi:prephenate dehydratase
MPSIAGVFDRILDDDGCIGVVPIENPVAGTVHVVQDRRPAGASSYAVIRAE